MDAFFAGILTKTIGTWTVTGFYELGALGDPGGTTDWSHGLAVGGGRPLGGPWGSFVEVAGVFIPEMSISNVSLLAGGTYAVSDFLVLDAGLSVGLTDDAPDATFFAGFTSNLGHMMPAARR